MAPKSFLEWPAELRNAVYDYALVSKEPVRLLSQAADSSRPLSPPAKRSNLEPSARVLLTSPDERSASLSAISLLYVCKQISREALPVFCGSNTFSFEAADAEVLKWLTRCLNPRNLQCLRSIRIDHYVFEQNDDKVSHRYDPLGYFELCRDWQPSSTMFTLDTTGSTIKVSIQHDYEPIPSECPFPAGPDGHLPCLKDGTPRWLRGVRRPAEAELGSHLIRVAHAFQKMLRREAEAVKSASKIPSLFRPTCERCGKPVTIFSATPAAFGEAKGRSEWIPEYARLRSAWSR